MLTTTKKSLFLPDIFFVWSQVIRWSWTASFTATIKSFSHLGTRPWADRLNPWEYPVTDLIRLSLFLLWLLVLHAEVWDRGCWFNACVCGPAAVFLDDV